jgi:5-methylcytosine rRNA methyltransferase NSUN4
MGSGSKKARKGKEAFEAHFHSLYGDRWPHLKEALLREREQIRLKDGLLKEYHLDEASCYPPELLNVGEEESVLDLCSAPGGKAIQLALALGGRGRLVLNELSRTRRQRLEKVVEEHLEEKDRKNIEIWGKDGSRLGQWVEERFDAILVDAPCSSERHLIENPSHLETWGPKRTKQLAHRQMGLLCSALDLLKSSGRLVYSTCSISPEENEVLIQRFLKKRKDRIEVVEDPQGPGEPRPFGRLIFPDESNGHGPMYVCLLRAPSEVDSFD